MHLFRLSSMVEQPAVNRFVAGSSPAGGEEIFVFIWRIDTGYRPKTVS